MSFKVVIRQRPEGTKAVLVNTELSNVDLQLRLFRDPRGIMTINGHEVTPGQKQALRELGMKYQITDIQPKGSAMLVSLRREGIMRELSIDQTGQGRYVPVGA